MSTDINLITNWLDQHGDKETDRFIEKNLAIVEKVRIALEEKGWKLLDLANAMNKSSSEVSKWLTGMHNLTFRSIIKLEIALGIDLINTEPQKIKEPIYFTTIIYNNPAEEDVKYESSNYSLVV